jgi:uncharacterized iron-regulated membrane protein
MRRFLLQVHLWAALICGIYVVAISLSGSAVVMRRELGRWYAPPTSVEIGDTRLSDEALRTLIEHSYPSYSIIAIRASREARLPVAVTLGRGQRTIERRFNPYTGADLGDPFPPVLRVLSWLVDFHDELLVGTTGRKINGIGGAALLLIILTGAVLWWPGRARWRYSLTLRWRDRGQRFIWRLHSTLGFWTFALLLVWGLTAVYFAFPNPVEALIDYFDPNLDDFERPGEPLLLALVAAHFGRFGGLEVRFAWMALGLVPIVLFVTGFLLWWKKR